MGACNCIGSRQNQSGSTSQRRSNENFLATIHQSQTSNRQLTSFQSNDDAVKEDIEGEFRYQSQQSIYGLEWSIIRRRHKISSYCFFGLPFCKYSIDLDNRYSDRHSVSKKLYICGGSSYQETKIMQLIWNYKEYSINGQSIADLNTQSKNNTTTNNNKLPNNKY